MVMLSMTWVQFARTPAANPGTGPGVPIEVWDARNTAETGRSATEPPAVIE
jgi:hypothetical protein